ncbi:MAG: family 16 glycoside hydrolase [Deltaproteobacteria bacterium]
MPRPQRPPEAHPRATERRPAPGARLQSVRLLCWLTATGVGGCATVTHEDPPSRVDGANGVQGNLPSGSGAGSGSAPLADVLAPVGTNLGGPPGPIETNPGERMPPVAAVSNGGSSGTPTPTVDAGPQFASDTLLLEENFENFQAAPGDWATSPGSTWSVGTDPQLVSNVYTQTETTSNTPHLATAGDVAWRDVVVETDLQVLGFNGSSSSYMAGLCVRVRDAEDFYLIGVRSNDGKVGVRRYTDGGTNLVQSSFDQGTTGRWYHLRVEVVGSTITAFLDDVLMFSETDSTHANGGIALCTVRATASFDNVRVTAP